MYIYGTTKPPVPTTAKKRVCFVYNSWSVLKEKDDISNINLSRTQQE